MVEKSFTIRYDVGVVKTGQNADFVKGVLLFFARQFLHFHFFESINFAVLLSLDLEDTAVCAIAYWKNLLVKRAGARATYLTS